MSWPMLLAIAAGLRCLTVGGRPLWERYDTGDNLLFRQSDLHAPTESPLFRELLEIRDPQAQSLVKELYNACLGWATGKVRERNEDSLLVQHCAWSNLDRWRDVALVGDCRVMADQGGGSDNCTVVAVHCA